MSEMEKDEEKNIDPVVEAIGALTQKKHEDSPVDLNAIVKKLSDKRQKTGQK